MGSGRTLALVLLLVVAACAKEPQGSAPGSAAPAKPISRVKQLGAPEFKAQAEQTGGLILDVRTPDEVARGRLFNASVIDINDPRFDQKVALLQKDKPVFVYCASGARSRAAAEMMVRMGFKDVSNLLGGIGSWAGEGFPIDRSGAPPPSSEGLQPEAFDKLLASERRVLVDFNTPWCAPCKRMAPVVDAIAEAWKGKVKVVKVDVDQSEALAQREKVSGVPVFVLYLDGKERWRKSGELPRGELESQIAQVQ